MSNIIQITNKQNGNKKKAQQLFTQYGFDFDTELETDIEQLRKSWSKSDVEISREEAIQVAADFYRRYPVLMEYVRNSDLVLKGN
ncbi:hypothetical protein GCM10008018_36550 [Paenibacillus marchantiophytorum]|uniref:Uncharacterized protein n=1 Tax=Paenibacillus marchantiophytorum TaxID=1619310 RepID=A0ABQ1EUP5_9BACL|nr:hypothetical protein [Paenibacillus marchantiophytorum]GFZ87070.1 hypothetical protein GCM10008018_36550 [Paenibacillus marchantiophytorum]